MIKDFKNVLVFAAHHDDETLGCGATISKLSDWFSNITVVFFTNGDTGVDQTKNYEKDIIATRKQEANEAAKVLGISNIVELNHPCQKLENTQKTLHNTIQIIRGWKPDLVLTHSPNDIHRDHKVAHALVEESYYKSYENIHPELGKCHKPTLGLCYEVFQQHTSPDVYVSVSESDINKKITAFEKYNSQHDLLSQDDSVINYLKSLARVRGFSAGSKYCESFTFLGRNRLIL